MIYNDIYNIYIYIYIYIYNIISTVKYIIKENMYNIT